MQRIVGIVALLLTAAVVAAGSPPPVFAGEGEPSSEAAQAVEPSSCATRTPLQDLSAAELTTWAAEADLELISPSASATSSTPLCPDRISCEPCEQSDGPCFIREFGSNSCCVSPTGPCILCPEGTTILVTTCPCAGLSPSCPRRDQDWECG